MEEETVELIEKIWEVARKEGVNLASLEIYTENDLLNYALKFLLANIEDLEEIVDDEIKYVDEWIDESLY